MADIRLKTRRFSLGGKEYEICVNMNVLADLQEQHDGSIAAVLNPKAELRTSLEIMAAMLNEASDAAGDPERFTARALGRQIEPSRINEVREIVQELVHAALMSDEPEDAASAADGENESKN